MGIEALNTAARAAGFAMAAPDDTPEEESAAKRPALEASWRPGSPVSLWVPPVAAPVARPSQVADWFRSMLAGGRGAPAGAR
jgi:hypothetical protein